MYIKQRAFPKDDVYGLASQRRRSASSICANIAEGAAVGEVKRVLAGLLRTLRADL
jgi:four helix bundle protein